MHGKLTFPSVANLQLNLNANYVPLLQGHRSSSEPRFNDLSVSQAAVSDRVRVFSVFPQQLRGLLLSKTFIPPRGAGPVPGGVAQR